MSVYPPKKYIRGSRYTRQEGDEFRSVKLTPIIRDSENRTAFFKELYRNNEPSGQFMCCLCHEAAGEKILFKGRYEKSARHANYPKIKRQCFVRHVENCHGGSSLSSSAKNKGLAELRKIREGALEFLAARSLPMSLFETEEWKKFVQILTGVESQDEIQKYCPKRWKLKEMTDEQVENSVNKKSKNSQKIFF